MLRVFFLLMLAVLAVSGMADLACAQKLTEAKNLPLPPALWANGASAVSGQLLARVAMRKVKYARVLSQRALALPAEAAAWPASEVPGGVRRLELAGPDSGLRLSDFNEARLDYLTDSPDQPGCLGFVVELSGNGERAVFVSDPLETVDHLTPQWADGAGRESIPVASASWTGKGLRYQLSRLLDRAPDDLWRTSQDGLSTFLQRRFNKPVQELGAIDVVLLRGQEVQVNAVVALDPGSRARTVLDWYALPKRFFDLGDGRTILRLYVGRHLREIAPERSGVLLKELSLMFFKQNVGDVERDRNVEKILFVPTGLDGELLAQGLPRNLPARAREVFAGRGELAANLQALGQAPWKDMPLARFSVVQSPQNPQNSQTGHPFRQGLEASRLANVAPRRDVPAIVAAMAERCASFGASCDVEAPDGLVSQNPLWSLDFQAFAGSGSGGGSGFGAAVHPALTGNLFTSPGRLSFTTTQDGLAVESASGGLVLETGAAFVPSANTRYSLWLELGRERQGLASVVAEVYGPDKSVRVAVKPGFPAIFPEMPSRVDGVRLHFAPSGQEKQEMPEMSVTLRRAALNALADDAPRQSVFSARTLFDEAQALTPVSLGESRLKFAPVGPHFTPQWLILDVSTTHWTVKDRPAHLELSVGSTSVTLPLPGAASRLAVYLPPLLGTLSGGASWPEITLALSGGAQGAGLECSRAVLSGQRLASWPQVLGGEALLQMAGEDRSLAGLDASGASNMAVSAHWLPMGGANLPEGAAPVRFVRNPWLEVEALLLADVSGPKLSSLGRDASSPKPGAVGGASKAGKWLAGLGVILAGYGAWRMTRRAGPDKLARISDWLCGNDAARPAAPRGWVWSGLLALVLACGFVLGPEIFRAVSLVGTVLAVPVWRALRPWLAAKAPGLAKSAPVHYCTGFLAAAVLATALRLLGAAPLSELLGLGGLWLFLAALASQTSCSPTECD
ncbi:MAG: hypothetical protein FD177_324 [Desulfovibrionaceae bacterium]|nr:MAG: hypothetical protein FD177_324 [Desulfovibrionaceae bacterium]